MGHKNNSSSSSSNTNNNNNTGKEKEVSLIEGVPVWVQPNGVKDVEEKYYREITGNQSILDALNQFQDTKLVSSRASGGNYGKTIAPGSMGLYFNRGRPKFRRPGKYLRVGYRCERAHESVVSENRPVINHGDIDIIQLGQNQCAVVLRPDHTVGLLAPGRHILRGRMKVVGEGIYNRAGIDKKTKRAKNFLQHVYDGSQWRATLVDVPKDYAAVIERINSDGAELAIVPPGRYTLTEEGVKFKKLLTLFEEERTLSAVKAFTNDSVEVFVDLQIRFRLDVPALIAHTKYADAFDVLQESSQSALQSVVGQINYQQMMQTISLAAKEMDVKNLHADVRGETFDEKVRFGVKDYLDRVGARVGVQLIDVFVMGRHFNKELTRQMQSQAQRTLESVTKAKNINRDLQTNKKKVDAEAISAKTRADAEFYSADRIANAKAAETRAAASANAEAK